MSIPSLDKAAQSGATISTDTQTWGKNSAADPAFHSQKYAEWIASLKRADIFPAEQLLPRIIEQDCVRWSPAMERSGQRPTSPELLAHVRAHNWGYWFPLGGGETTLGPASAERAITRRAWQLMLYRMNSINAAVAELYGNDLTGKSVLDLACNHGAFSLDLVARGAASARGVDLREENIVKARLLAHHVGLDNVEFERGDIYEESGPGHIVLCLGVLYHVTKPYELVELCYRLCTEMAVIDTVTHREPFSGFILGLGQMIGAEHAAGAVRTELHPTYRGLIDLMRSVGFREIIEAEGIPDQSWIDWGKAAYANKTRRCLIGLK
jgi:SAM-dependent methyltransferase